MYYKYNLSCYITLPDRYTSTYDGVYPTCGYNHRVPGMQLDLEDLVAEVAQP